MRMVIRYKARREDTGRVPRIRTTDTDQAMRSPAQRSLWAPAGDGVGVGEATGAVKRRQLKRRAESALPNRHSSRGN